MTPPLGYVWSCTCLPQDPPPFAPTSPSPIYLGHGEDGDTGFLISNECTDYYLTFELEIGAPFVFTNNFPFTLMVGGSTAPANRSATGFHSPEYAVWWA